MYEKQNFQPEEVLSAEQLNHIEDGITKFETELGNVKIELEDVKKHGSDVKEMLAAAITEKGVETASTDSFTTMAENVGKISGGGVVSKSNNTRGTFSNALVGIATTVTNKKIYVQEG